MQIIMNKDTKMRFKLDLVDLKRNRTNKEFSMVFFTLNEAREYADWAENNGYRVDQLILELES